MWARPVSVRYLQQQKASYCLYCKPAHQSQASNMWSPGSMKLLAVAWGCWFMWACPVWMRCCAFGYSGGL